MPDPWGCAEHVLTVKPARPEQNSECTHTKKALWQFTGACSGSHISARAGQRYRAHSAQYLKRVVSATRKHTRLFIYSPLVNARNRCGRADVLAILSH